MFIRVPDLFVDDRTSGQNPVVVVLSGDVLAFDTDPVDFVTVLILLEQSVGYAEFRSHWNNHFRVSLEGLSTGFSLSLYSDDIPRLEIGLERVSGLIVFAGGVRTCSIHFIIIDVWIIKSVEMKILLDEQVIITVVQFAVCHKSPVDIALDRTGIDLLDAVSLAYRQIDKVQGVADRHL